MNMIAEPRHQVSSSKPMQSDQGSKGAGPKAGLRELWLAILAMVAVAALGAAVALGAFDSSSDSAAKVTTVDPRLDADFHRAAPVPSVSGLDQAVVDPRIDSDSHREPPTAPASATSATPHYVNGGLDPAEQLAIYEQVNSRGTTDPRQDADHHREAGE